MSTTKVFVCGATGTQGGAIARHLRDKNIKVNALARDPTSAPAKALEALGVKLWHGDYDSKEVIAAAMAGCTAVFINLMPNLQDLSTEIVWAKNLLEASKAAGANHVVYSSGFGANQTEKMEFLDQQGFVAMVLRSKHAIELEVQAAGYEHWTILRPGNFMANYLPPLVRMYAGLIETGVWTTAMKAETVLPLVDTETIGRFGAAAILEPERFGNKDVIFADQLMGGDEIMAELSAATGRELKAVYLTDGEIEEQKGSNIFVGGQLAMRDMSQFVNLDEVKEWGIPLSTFKAFLEREKERVNETYNKTV
ncbi:hypothetical protein QQX98_006050 [Neonectria punicea]|uniref:NmrA-like domain-containing protein n=1 Tax=Neonectria punicea TaxID=979145 RepID=A0ABR1H2N5_9HYPO